MDLNDEEWGKRSDRWIAEAAMVSNHFVADVRKQVLSTGNSPSSQSGDTVQCKDGKTRRRNKKHTRKKTVNQQPHLADYIREKSGMIELWRNRLSQIPADTDAWLLLNQDHPEAVKQLIAECESFVTMLQSTQPSNGEAGSLF